jgi:hypothetical protein
VSQGRLNEPVLWLLLYLFQAAKFDDPIDVEAIRDAKTAFIVAPVAVNDIGR